MSKPDDLPCFVVCEKPVAGGPETLTPGDDYFLEKDGKARYPMIGVLNVHARPRFSFVNSTVGLGIALDRAHRGK